ncbi:related to Protein ERP6 [Hanseniaspora guilliermondii]|uniref:Related to Protein ERP6 n=1 Tax=Hanseniaspora guilliermondii TaxID=56406 RepID=A0A1L0AYD2_9ASCO|nr:related to Protein ERP6 [Hanseniaspora guilliermondii]
MKYSLVSFFSIVLLYLVPCTNGFYVYMTGGEKKCFNKELSKDTILNGKYSLEVYDSNSDEYITPKSNELGLIIDVEEVFDDYHRVVHQKGSSNSEFAFVALDSGEHRICFQVQSSGWIAKVKTKFDIQFEVAHDIEVLDSKQKTKQKNLQNKVNILSFKVKEIKREQDLVRERESQFRDLSESVNAKVVWWGVIQLIVLGLTCVWQLNSLKGFFVKQKIL